MYRTMLWIAAAAALAALIGCGEDAGQETKRAMGAAVTPKPSSKANQATPATFLPSRARASFRSNW